MVVLEALHEEGYSPLLQKSCTANVHPVEIIEVWSYMDFPLLQHVRSLGHHGLDMPPFSALTVTVPGAAALWEDVIKTYGNLTLKQV